MNDRRISQNLANGAEYLVVGEIIAHTGLLANLAPRNNANYDVIVNSHDLQHGCRVEVKHSRSGFKANIRGSDYDFLVFVYAPSEIIDGMVVPISKREIYVFPKEVVEKSDRGETKTNFNPKKYVPKYKEYKRRYDLILDFCSPGKSRI